LKYCSQRHNGIYAAPRSIYFIYAFAAFFSASALATPPTLYTQPAFQSPVRGDPDDLLLLAGIGFSVNDKVVYQAIYNTVAPPQAPSTVPAKSTAESGLASVVSTANVPYSLTILLPTAMRKDQSYSLWVRTDQGEWSAPVRINDARPLWISPAYVRATQTTASLPRYLNVIGRNLQPTAGGVTLVRLKGPETLTLTADREASASAALHEYVALVRLPATLRPGNYRVEVNRDGASWVGLAGQSLEVRADSPTVAEFPVGRAEFGGCRPNDGQDDTPCIVRAIQAAKAAGGGNVIFGAGTWDLVSSSQDGVVAGEGIVVAEGVNLVGSGASITRIERHPAWQGTTGNAAFTLVGHNVVRGLTLHDTQIYHPTDRAGAFLELGENYQRVSTTDPKAERSVKDVVITGNIFDRTRVGIADGGLPISSLFVTYNEFGAYASALELAGNRFNMTYKFRLDDSVIAYNTFNPSSYILPAEKQGVLASEIGAGHRVDFSHNNADGTSEKYLYSTLDPHGWRAAFFWHMNNDQEMLLVSQNIATCTGDKIGDGEAIAYDNNANTFAFDSARTVLEASNDTVTVAGPLQAVQNGREVPIGDYYVGHWIQVGEGSGVGQVLKIVAYEVNAVSGSVTFKVSPQWDVIPATGKSRIATGREFWQVYTVANTIDHRKPLCRKSNRTANKGGVIALWAQMADSVVEDNKQFDSDGILMQNLYSAYDPICGADCWSHTNFMSFVEIRGNLIDGEYDWTDDCSSSGILGSMGASPTSWSRPPTAGSGLSISHNTIARADAWRGGAIALRATWYEGPEPHRWDLVNNALIFHNTLLDLDGPPARACRGDSPKARAGISLSGSSLAARTVLYANTCDSASRPLDSGSQQIVKVCRTSTQKSCECE
jgi:hypothetical protein